MDAQGTGEGERKIEQNVPEYSLTGSGYWFRQYGAALVPLEGELLQQATKGGSGRIPPNFAICWTIAHLTPAQNTSKTDRFLNRAISTAYVWNQSFPVDGSGALETRENCIFSEKKLRAKKSKKIYRKTVYLDLTKIKIHGQLPNSGKTIDTA